MLSFFSSASNKNESRIETLKNAATINERLGNHRAAADNCIEILNLDYLKGAEVFWIGIRISERLAHLGLTDDVNHTIQKWVLPNELVIPKRRVGTALFDVAEILGRNGHNAITVYKLAISRLEDVPSHVVKCYAKIGETLASQKSFREASEAFMEAGKIAVKGDLSKFGAKNHFLNAILCLAASNPLTSSLVSELNVAVGLDYMFKGSREEMFLADLIKGISEGSLVSVNESITAFTSVVPMEPWRSDILKTIASHLQ